MELEQGIAIIEPPVIIPCIKIFFIYDIFFLLGGPASIPVYVAAQSERGSPDLCHAWSAIRSDQPHLAGQHVQQHHRAPQPLRRLYGGSAQR